MPLSLSLYLVGSGLYSTRSFVGFETSRRRFSPASTTTTTPALLQLSFKTRVCGGYNMGLSVTMGKSRVFHWEREKYTRVCISKRRHTHQSHIMCPAACPSLVSRDAASRRRADSTCQPRARPSLRDRSKTHTHTHVAAFFCRSRVCASK